MQLAIIIGILTWISEFISHWVWNPPYALGFMTVVLICDWISAIARDCKIANGFSTQKSERFVLKLIAYWMILGIVFNLPRINTIHGTESVQSLINKMPSAIYMVMLSYTITSIVKNWVLAKQLDGRIAKVINKYIDTYKNPKQ